MACIIQKRKRRVLSSISFSTRSFIPKFQIIFNFSLSLFFTVSFSLRLFRSIFSTPSLLLHVLPFFEDKGHLFPRLHELTIVRFHSPRFPFPYPSSDSSSSSSSTRYLWQPGLFATPRHPWFRAHFRRPKAVPFSPPESTLRPPQITSSHYSALLPLLLFSLSLLNPPSFQRQILLGVARHFGKGIEQRKFSIGFFPLSTLERKVKKWFECV